MKHPINGNFLNEIFSKEIQSILHKKVFARSKYFNSTKKPPEDATKIKPTVVSSTASIVKSYIFCAFILSIYFVNIFRLKSKNSGKNLILVYSLTKNQAIRNGSIKSLYTFLESKDVVDDFEYITLIEVRKILWTRKYKMARTTLDIPLRIYINNFSPTLKMNCWLSMCKKFFEITQLQRKNWHVSLVLKEFVFDQIVYSAMDPKKLKKLITTQSNIAYQPLIFEYETFKAKKLMIWYSSNSIPIKYKNEKLNRFVINPATYLNMQINEHWVWTKEHKDYLSNYCQAKILVKKSLMFYTVENSITSNKIIDLLVFDVTPASNPAITSNSIYTTKEVINFINEINACVKMLNHTYKMDYKIHLKHKRRFSKTHSSYYSKFINQRVKNSEIYTIDSNQNLYDLINNSKLVIGFPFTSPVVIGQELNKPSIFYCSSKMLPTAHKNQRLSLIQDQTSLYTYMEKVLVNAK
jgi:polysaccharide biosynthesis PFTS motif protein